MTHPLDPPRGHERPPAIPGGGVLWPKGNKATASQPSTSPFDDGVRALLLATLRYVRIESEPSASPGPELDKQIERSRRAETDFAMALHKTILAANREILESQKKGDRS